MRRWAVFLNKYLVEAVICGGIGGGAIQALERFDIAVFADVAGDADQAVEDLLADRLIRTVAPNCDHACSNTAVRIRAIRKYEFTD
ncbi:MAG: NifB/NifX family molybdenum-iron cluster-binding protein [Eubacterium sp.]